jgi:hypothetical protein
MIAALNQFMAKIAEQSLPFFQVLRGSGTFEWGLKQLEAFKALKEYIWKLPTLASPQLDQLLILYVSATHTAISGALVQEKEILKVPIYFVSEALVGSKVLSGIGKDMLCHSHVCKKASALFQTP